MKEKILKLKQKNPKWGYGKIAKALGCGKGAVQYHLSPTRKKTESISQASRRKRKKLIIINEMGGKCKKCGYGRCLDALEFHHLDPNQKEFTIARIADNLPLMREEATKCIVLCANCHREIEAGLWGIDL